MDRNLTTVHSGSAVTEAGPQKEEDGVISGAPDEPSDTSVSEFVFFLLQFAFHISLCAACFSRGKGLIPCRRGRVCSLSKPQWARQTNLGVRTGASAPELGGGPVRRGHQEGQTMPLINSSHQLTAAV